MLSSFKQFQRLSTIENLEKSLYSLPVVIKNKKGESISLNAIYQDSNPSGSSLGTCLGLHGCPGSHIDFKYIEPLLTKAGVRFIGINFPGLGFTPYDERLQNDNFERDQYVQQMIKGLNLKENLVFMGHSRGTENALTAVAENPDKAKGLVLLNPIGVHVHRGIRPRWRVALLASIWAPVWFRFVSNWLLLKVYNYLNLRVSNGHEAGVCVSTMVHCAVEKQRPYIDAVNKSSAKVLIASSGKDWLIESWISKKFMALFKDMHYLETSTTGDDTETTSKVIEQFDQGTKSVGILFQNEGHFLQKHRAQLASEVIIKMLSSKK